MSFKRKTASDYTFDELPELPEGWKWEKCSYDGDPTAIREGGGIVTRIYTSSDDYTNKLSITVSRPANEKKNWDPDEKLPRDPSLHGHPPCRVAHIGCVDAGVFEAVQKAVKWWFNEVLGPPYGKDSW